MFSERPALWVNGKEIAHRDTDNTFDVRMTRGVIRELRSRFRTDPRVRLRPSSSADWLEVALGDATSEELLVELVDRAADAHRPVSGKIASRPPRDEALARRRRFH